MVVRSDDIPLPELLLRSDDGLLYCDDSSLAYILDYFRLLVDVSALDVRPIRRYSSSGAPLPTISGYDSDDFAYIGLLLLMILNMTV
jgi:hypothetical protein